PDVDRRRQADLASRQETADVRVHRERDPPPPIGVALGEKIRTSIAAGRHDDTRVDFERFAQPLVLDIQRRRRDLVSAFTVPAALDVQRRVFLKAIEPPVALVARMRLELTKSELRQTWRADVPAQRRADLPIAIGALQDADFGVEVVADLGIAERRLPRSRPELEGAAV